MASRPRKRLAFTAPGNAATRAIIARNASNSGLLRLPLEVRDKIWREVLGDKLIHITYVGSDDENQVPLRTSKRCPAGSSRRCIQSGPWRHRVCQEDGPEARDEVHKIASFGAMYIMAVPHDNCDPYHERTWLPFELSIREIHLTVLRVCRHAYVEANNILWTTNTFSFNDKVTFTRFFMDRTVHQKRMIKHLRFHVYLESIHSFQWDSALSMARVSALTGLRCLRLCILYKMPQFQRDFVEKEKSRFLFKNFGWLERLSTLPLNKVEVAVKDLPSEASWGNDNDGDEWMKNDREKFAAYLQTVLLDPRGPENYAEGQRDQEERKKQKRDAEVAARAMKRSLRPRKPTAADPSP